MVILERPQEARDTFASLLQAAAHVPMLHLQLGLACQQLGNLPEAIEKFQKAWQQQPPMAYAALSLALALYSDGQPESAFATLAEAARRFPQELQVFEVLYRLLQETPAATGPAYQEARSALFRQRGSRTGHFLEAVEKLVREQGKWEEAQPVLAEGHRLLEEGDVVQAEKQGVALCEELDLGLVVKLGPEGQERGTQSWRCYVFWLPDAAFQGRQHDGADFRIFSRGWRDTAVDSVRVLIP